MPALALLLLRLLLAQPGRAQSQDPCLAAPPPLASLSPPLLRSLLHTDPNSHLQALGDVSDSDAELTRTFLSPAHRRAAQLIKSWMLDAGLESWIDAVGNVHGRANGSSPDDLPAVMVGSHYDTVIDGGRFDGALGVIAAVAAARALRARCPSAANGTIPGAVRPLRIVAFSDEEGARFGTTFLGSRALTGRLAGGGTMGARDASGRTLGEVLAEEGFEAEGVRMGNGSVEAYVEVHMEQGPRLNESGSSLGVVSSIAGQTRLLATIRGVQGHAGTVPMGLRRDAMTGAAEAVLFIERTCLGAPNLEGEHKGCPSSQEGCVDDLVCTVGQISIWPGSSNVISGFVNFTVDVRSGEDAVREAAVSRVTEGFMEICARRGLTCAMDTVMHAPAVHCSEEVVSSLVTAVTGSKLLYDKVLSGMEDGMTSTFDDRACSWADGGGECHTNSQGADSGVIPVLVSGAGHDALAMAHIAPIGMVFVRDNGISHSPAEFVHENDVAAATTALAIFLESSLE
eukprot:evm.model.scf_4391.2 EVM.evm.TU.scf_4391.2   scf_4391:1938-4777(-)